MENELGKYFINNGEYNFDDSAEEVENIVLEVQNDVR